MYIFSIPNFRPGPEKAVVVIADEVLFAAFPNRAFPLPTNPPLKELSSPPPRAEPPLELPPWSTGAAPVALSGIKQAKKLP